MDEQSKYSKSIQAFAEACNYVPGGVNSPVRAFGGVDIGPVFIASAKGSKIYDIDGNEYIDYVGSWGPMILGHAHPEVLKAIVTAARKGTSFGAPTLAETANFTNFDELRELNRSYEQMAIIRAIRCNSRNSCSPDVRERLDRGRSTVQTLVQATWVGGPFTP